MALVTTPRLLTTSNADVYTCPSAKTARIIHAQVANVGTAATSFDLSMTDSSASNSEFYLCRGVPLPDNTSVGPVAGELSLAAGDKIRARAGHNSRAHLTITFDVQNA